MNDIIRKYKKPVRVFEKSGLVIPEMSYYVPLENVVNRDKQDIRTMIDKGRFFSIFAPRQSGKTTFFTETCKELQKDPAYVGIILSFQDNRDLDSKEFYGLIERYLYRQLLERLEAVGCEKLDRVTDLLNKHHLTNHISFKLFFEDLNHLIRFKKIVIFIDEFDGIPTQELGNFLTVLRELYQSYKSVKEKALFSVGLVGIRDITKLVIGGVSPFNIADQVTLPPFSLNNIRDLYMQFTLETNQPFTENAIKRIYEETGGQPWLVNRLGTILTLDVKPETVEPIDEVDVKQALGVLFNERNNHFDNLYEKVELYKEAFVEIVFDGVTYNAYNKEQSWLEQYGLIKQENGKAAVANNIYKSIFLKTFFDEAGASGAVEEYSLPGNRLDMNRVFLDFSRYIAQIGVRAFYKDQKPHERTGQFLLTAWLYRFVKDGNGDLRYEIPTGLGRMDILLLYKGKRYIIETKVNRQEDISTVIQDGVTQVAKKYLSTESADNGYLVIYDTKTEVGVDCEPKNHRYGDKTVTEFTIGIGRPANLH